MNVWIETLMNGLMLGGLYALFGLGLSLIFGVMRIANIAHGELVIGGAFMAFSIAGAVPLPPIMLVALVTALMFALGWAVQSALVNRVLGSDPLRPLLLTFGLSVLTQNLLVELFGADSRSLDIGSFKTAALTLGTLSVGLLPLVTFGLTLLLFALLHWGLHHSAVGRVVRATADDPEIVALMGVNRKQVFAGVMALSAALAALAGMLLAMRSTVTPFSGAERLLIAFEVVVIGGLGSIWASLAGGLALGLVHAVSFRADPASGLLYGHILLLAILLIRPEGLAGKRRTR
ncbi:branched-chain amino acid ABC transporter permease [Gemmobacter denitrificans]|uniref:Branched-chain amino acid ABC transporter permease n=1 Tax=Gemmobacter denitrificans TaxID=3123040 RepID=A0ABU8BV58_9RHOB